jgi:tetratricopeptide (TPR) repeat protein
MKAKLFLILSFSLALGAAAHSQGSQGGSGSGGMAPTPKPPGPAASTNIGDIANRDTTAVQGRSGDYLAGSVTIAGGALPWDPFAVTVTCDGKTRYTSTTDAKGNFRIAPANKDASPSANSDAKTKLVAQLVGCAVQAALPGFDSSTITIANHHLVDDPNIGTLTLKREDASAGAAVSTTTAAAPKDAMKAFDKARTELLDGKPDRAQKDLEKAVQIYPQFAEAWYQLGKIQEASKKDEAGASFSKAVTVDPKFILPYEQLAPMAAQAGNWQQLVDYTSHELELNPHGNPQTWYLNALGNVKLNKIDAAQTSVEKALAMDPLHTQPNAEQLLAVILAGKRDYAAALQHLRNCLTYLPPGPNAEIIKQQIAQLEPIVGAPK